MDLTESFITEKKQCGHDVKLLKFYDSDTLCTVIAADFTDKTLVCKNYVSNFVKTAFGNNHTPDWNDFDYFLRERCIPETRDGLNIYLEQIGVSEFDPFEIILVTKGRMAKNKQHLEVEDV